MLQYGLSENFIKHLSRLAFNERMDILWKVQGLLSHVPGYLRLKVDGTEEDPIYQIGEKAFVLAHDDYASRVLLDFASEKDSLVSSDRCVKASIVDLLGKKELESETKETFKYALDNHFPLWFINLLNLLPNEDQKILMSIEEIKEDLKENNDAFAEEVVISKAPEVQELTHESNDKPKKAKTFVDGEKFEKEILRQLAKAYALRKKTAKAVPSKPLKHVKLAPREVIIPFSNLGECLFLAKKRTTKLGCKLNKDDWKFLLATSVDESIAYQLERRYPKHVCYTDEPNKGDLKIAFIVKPKKKEEKQDELEVKKVVSKTASFQNDLPSGAFENIDEDDIPEYIPHSSFKPLVQKNVVHVSNEVKLEKIEEDMEEFFEEDFFDSEFSFEESDISVSSELPSERDDGPKAPTHWHCHLCGKKKLYSGEPAETVQLAGGKIVYLCNKHRGKM